MAGSSGDARALAWSTIAAGSPGRVVLPIDASRQRAYAWSEWPVIPVDRGQMGSFVTARSLGSVRFHRHQSGMADGRGQYPWGSVAMTAALMRQTGSDMITMEWGAATDRGLVRSINEDSLLAAPPVFLVADGMGGYQAGATASAIVVEEFTIPADVARVTAEWVIESFRARGFSHPIRRRRRHYRRRNGGGTTRLKPVLAVLQYRGFAGLSLRRRSSCPGQRRSFGCSGTCRRRSDRTGGGQVSPGSTHHHPCRRGRREAPPGLLADPGRSR